MIVGGNSLVAPLLDKQWFNLIEVKKYGQFAELVLEKHHH